MDIWMIWATESGQGYFWLAEAWDDDTVSENYEGWTAALAKAREDHGADNVRVVKASMDFAAVRAAFKPADAGDLRNPEPVND